MRFNRTVAITAALALSTAWAGELELKKAWKSVDEAFKAKNDEIAKSCGKKIPLEYEKKSFDGMEAKYIGGGYTSSPKECLEVGTQMVNFICSEKANAADEKEALLKKV